MTAVLSPTDLIRRDRIMSSLDDNQINYSSGTDWRAKYYEMADMLAETRAELDDFHHASKELEAELENELQRTEKSQQDLKVKAARAETERDEWKSKFVSLQTTHNTTTASLQHQLDKLRQEYQRIKVQLRELEMGNDDLERNERAVSSSLADVEAKYSRALEEKILLEHELLDKANLEEQCQRLRDELRDANEEISILKDQLSSQTTSAISATTNSTASDPPSSIFPNISDPSDDDLLRTPPPPNLNLSDLSPDSESLTALSLTPRAPAPSSFLGTPKGQSSLLQRAGFQPNKSSFSTPPGISRIAHSTTLSSLYNSSPRTPISRPSVSRNPSSASTASSASNTTNTTSKNKGVQMVSEMRARVRNLEQKIHTRVPRLRMGSVTARPNANSVAMSDATGSSSSSSLVKSAIPKSPLDERGTSVFAPQPRKSTDIHHGHAEKARKIPSADSTGWVLIMGDSPSPAKERRSVSPGKERRSIPVFHPVASTSSPPIAASKPNIAGTGIRRPASRLSAASLSTTATSSSIATPTSRPTSPTFLPVPTTGLYAHPTTAGMTGLKRSSVPVGVNPFSQSKRSSLGSSTMPLSSGFSYKDRPAAMTPLPRPGSNNASPANSAKFEAGKALPQLPSLHTNVTPRQPSKLPASGTSNVLTKSRIGRPSLGSRRASGEFEGDLTSSSTENRPRAGSTTAKNGL